MTRNSPLTLLPQRRAERLRPKGTRTGAESLRCSQLKYQDVVSHSREVVFEADAAGDWLFLNPAWLDLTGFPVAECLGRHYLDFIHADDLARMRERIDSLLKAARSEVRGEFRLITRDGGYRWVELAARPWTEKQGGAAVIRGSLTDIHHRKLAQRLESDRTEVMEMIARNQPLREILTRLVHLVESQRHEVVGSVLLLLQGRPYHAAAPSLPRAFTRALDNRPMLAGTDFFSIAALSGKLQVVEDIAADPGWIPNRELARKHGLRACWAMPLHSGSGAPLGSFVVYSSSLRPPAAVDLELAAAASQLASIAIEQGMMADHLIFLAEHDGLTGLPNRSLLENRLQQALVSARRSERMAAVLYIDLDRFKEINDTLGHAVGDQLLQQVAGRLLGNVRQDDILARMGGDEFTLVLTGIPDPLSAQHAAQNLLASLAQPFTVEGHELFVTASIGISVFPRDGADAASLQRHADLAMYRAKALGKNNSQHFAPEMTAAASARMEMENLLRRVLVQERLELYYQPEVELDGRHTGFEALVRLHHPERGLVLPGEFIAIAEESGLIIEIGTWVLEQACRQNAEWQRAGRAPLTMAVNVSALQFARPDFVAIVDRALQCNNLPAQYLELELTESMLIANSVGAMEKLIELRSLGVGLVLDDFGTGYSSLAYLQRLPINRLKIDRMFIQEMSSPNGQARRAQVVVETIIGLARSLEIDVVAEGVETPEQRDFLLNAGCGRAQGYFFHPPMTALEAENYLQEAPRPA